MNRQFWSAVLLTMVFLLFSSAVFAEGIWEKLGQDLAPVEGLVIMASDQEVLVDLTAAKGLKVGDLCAVLTQGKEVSHPVTGEVLGITRDLRGVVRIVRMEENFAFGVPVSGEGFQRGESVKRYARIPAVTEGDMSLTARIQQELPALDWGAEKPLLRFRAEGGKLSVVDDRDIPLYAYTLPAPQVRPMVTSVVAPSPDAMSAQKGSSGAIVKREQAQQDGMWRSRALKEVPVGIAVADVDGDGLQEVVLLGEEKLVVQRVEGGTLKRLAEVEVSGTMQSLDAADLDKDGKAELYITANSANGDLSSQVFSFTEKTLKPVAENLSYYFRAVTLADGKRKLLGQKMGQEDDFLGPVFEVEAVAGKPLAGAKIAWDDDLELYGTQPMSYKGELLYGRLSPQQELLQAVAATGERLWESAEPFGGRDGYIPRPEKGSGARSDSVVRCYFLPARMEVGTAGELLVPLNDGSRTFECSRSFKNSRVTAYAWDGFSFNELWHTAEQNGYLADFAIGDADNDGKPEMVQAVIYSSGWFARDSAAVLVIELP